MANSKSNWPVAQNPDVKPGEMSVMVKLINDIRELERPKTDGEVEQRISAFFQWCIDNDVRPGVELMALSLGTTRQTLWNWQKEGGRKGEIITQAKQMIAALTENWGQTGKINPAAFCFIMKNNFGYSDNVTVETIPKQEPHRTIEQIEQERGQRFIDTAPKELPKGDF